MNNCQQFEHRANTQIITLGEITHEFAEPERLRLQLSPKVLKKPFDIGSFAYAIRGKNESIFDDRGTPVGIESFVENRRELIMRLLETFVGQRELTVLTRLRNTVDGDTPAACITRLLYLRILRDESLGTLGSRKVPLMVLKNFGSK